MNNDDDLGFTFQSLKGDIVQILRNRKVVTMLRGKKAITAISQLEIRDFSAQQQLMARLTGNYKRGNEKPTKPCPN